MDHRIKRLERFHLVQRGVLLPVDGICRDRADDVGRTWGRTEAILQKEWTLNGQDQGQDTILVTPSLPFLRRQQDGQYWSYWVHLYDMGVY